MCAVHCCSLQPSSTDVSPMLVILPIYLHVSLYARGRRRKQVEELISGKYFHLELIHVIAAQTSLAAGSPIASLLSKEMREMSKRKKNPQIVRVPPTGML